MVQQVHGICLGAALAMIALCQCLHVDVCHMPHGGTHAQIVTCRIFP